MNLFIMGKYIKFGLMFRSFSSAACSEYSNVSKYPPIFDPNLEEVRKRARKHEKYNELHTVEEKLFALNLDKYYGWNCMILKEYTYPYNFLPFVKFITRTYSLEVNKNLFHKVQNVDINVCKANAENLRKNLQDAILFELKGKRNINKDIASANAQGVLEAMNGVLLSGLSKQYPHLRQTVVDYQPRLEAFWMVGSFHPSEELFKERKDKKLDDEEASNLVDHWIQYFGAPVIQLRNHLPLFPLETRHINEYNDPTKPPEVYAENSDPSLNHGIQFERRHGTTIPGFWPEDEHEFGLISYHNQAYLMDRPPHFGQKEHADILKAQAILASFGWLHGQASYQGFSTFTDMTYPLVTQNVVSDGRQFNFSLYQLNTTLLYSDHSLNNARVNVHLTMPPSSLLYEEIRGNEFIGWNDDVVSTLISFYLNEPKEREGLKPFLHSEERYLTDIKENNRRMWLHQQYRHMYSNRPKHRLPYEIYDWERIYKLKFPTRQFEARLRPFELDSNPIEDRKYNEHMPAYVPKQFRPRKRHWTGWRAKYAKTYYSDV